MKEMPMKESKLDGVGGEERSMAEAEVGRTMEGEPGKPGCAKSLVLN